MSILLNTIGGKRVIATRIELPSGARRERGIIQFRNTNGSLVAVHAVSAVREAGRLFPIKPDEPDWVLGPVECSRLKTLAAESRSEAQPSPRRKPR